jgi:hypothetical protein
MNSADDSVWSAPDSDGVITCNLDVGAVSTLRGRRKRKGVNRRTTDVALWPTSWRDILKDWVKQGGTRRKWTVLIQIAGAQRVHDALPLFAAILKSGLIEVEELRENSRWQPLWIEFLDLDAIRESVGLSNRNKLQKLREDHSDSVLQNCLLEGLQQTLATMPAERAVRRHDILVALDFWIAEKRNGTRRDFALFARGDTKGVSSAEWEWIDKVVPLESIGISQHTPAFWLRAPIALTADKGTLDLHCISDCIGLTPETIKQVIAVEGRIECWRILENRTVFERVARHYGATDGVIWVPGFAPSWWVLGASKLLALCPAPALVACDPDPAGIDIAQNVGSVWTGQGLTWEPWKMDADTLSNLKQRKKLTDDDTVRLNRLLSQPLPETLNTLALWMTDHGEKGEQEGIEF